MTRDQPARKFKVCLLTVSLAGGGAERSCAMLSRMLSAHGHEVHIAILNDEIGYQYAGTLFNLGKLKPLHDTLLKRFRRMKQLRCYLKEQQIDVVIDHRPKNSYSRESFYDRFVYRNIPRIFVTHSSLKENYLTEKPIKFKRICNKNLANIAVSKYIENEILKANQIFNHRTIYNAFDPAWADLANKSAGVEISNPYILSYGRIDDRIKDFRFLIDAFDHSAVWKSGYHLLIMGDGKDTAILRAYADERDSAANIRFAPYNDNPFPIIRNARFVTLTSRYEGFPMVLTEALSLGTPVVSLDIVSGPSEIIEDRKNGLLIPERSIPLFSEAIKQMVTDEKLRANCAEHAKSSVASFSMTEIGSQWNKLLNDVL